MLQYCHTGDVWAPIMCACVLASRRLPCLIIRSALFMPHPADVFMQAASVVAVLLAGLTRLGGNAYIAKRLIAMLAAHAPGRSALRTACSRWRAQATGLPDDADAAHAAALQWAISRLWQQGARALHHSTPTLHTCGHIWPTMTSLWQCHEPLMNGL